MIWLQPRMLKASCGNSSRCEREILSYYRPVPRILSPYLSPWVDRQY
jgi:hypothetical protein